MTIGRKIYELRTEQGLSQEVFGERLGVSRQSVSKWETDQSVPELDKIVAISELFGVSTDYLLKETMKRDTYAEEYEAETEQETDKRTHASGTGYTYRRGSRPAYEYKSSKMIGGLPLVHIHFGLGLCKAKGIIAIGSIAQGVVAVGFLSAGVLSVGLLTAGLFALGTFAAGLMSYGSFAVGIVSFGAFSFGIFSMGAACFGEFGFGAFAYCGQVAVADEAHGAIALGVNETSRTVGTLYEATAPIDIKAAQQAIEEYVPDYWLFFKSWAKAMVKMVFR